MEQQTEEGERARQQEGGSDELGKQVNADTTFRSQVHFTKHFKPQHPIIC